MKVKKWLSLFTVICLGFLVAVSPKNVFAAGNLQVRNGTSSVTLTQTKADVFGDGTVSYDADTNTLTLNHATLAPTTNPSMAAIYDTRGVGLKIVVKGENKIVHDQAIYITQNGNLEISGEGSLRVEGSVYAIQGSGNITIDQAKVTASTTGSSNAGIHASGSILLRNKSNVSSSAANYHGIYATKGITVENSTLIASSRCTNGAYSGIEASSGDITIADSDVRVTANIGGIATAIGDITTQNSKVSIISGDAAINGKSVAISGGSVDATALNGEVNAIYAWDGPITISEGATVIANAEDESAFPAIYGNGGIVIKNSKVSAVSGGDAAIFSPETIIISEKAEIDANGYYAAINASEDVMISDSVVNATAAEDAAIYSGADVAITNSAVYANGVIGNEGILADGTASIAHSWIVTSGAETFEGEIENTALFHQTNGTLIGTLSLSNDVVLPFGSSLNFADGSQLTIEKGTTFTNNGTITGSIRIVNNGTLLCNSHVGGIADCVQCAVCAVCGNAYGNVDVMHHKHLEKVNAASATHLQEGNITYWHCDDCDRYFTDQDAKKEITYADTILSKLPHHENLDTWEANEQMHWQVCTCKENINEGKHTFVWVIDQEASATENGLKHEVCTVCGYKKAAVEILATGELNEQPTTTPSTGDNGSAALWLVLLLGSGIILHTLGTAERTKI